jgi:CRISPR-associated protein Cas2
VPAGGAASGREGGAVPLTVVVTRDVAPRFRGFLSSVMLEIAPGVYTSPTMTKGVRERVWSVLSDWFGDLGGGGIVMTWRDLEAPGRQAVLNLGDPSRNLVEADGMLLVKREI